MVLGRRNTQNDKAGSIVLSGLLILLLNVTMLQTNCREGSIDLLIG